MRVEFAALRSVAAFRRALALAIAFSGFLAISFLGVKDLDQTPIVDARSALSSGAVAGFAAVVYSAATAGGEVARGGLALALLGGADRRRATLHRLTAHAAAGAIFGLGGAVMAAALTYALLGIGGGPLPSAIDLLERILGTTIYTALMGVLGAALGLALRSPAAAVVTALVVLLALDPLFSGFSDPIARWGFGGTAGALTFSAADDLPPPWAGGLVLLGYAAVLGSVAAALTVRRDVP
jgi:ABC-2 type transport system permease protein